MLDRDTLVFRIVQQADKEKLLAFFKENNIPEVTATFTAFPLEESTVEYIVEREHRDIYNILISGQRVIGFSMLRGFEDGYTIPSFGIIIDYRFQNLGLGKHLLSLTIDQAKSIGCTKVRLSVYQCNQAGWKIYQAIGFREVERTKVDLLGKPDEKIIMIKELL
jgi:[ribosomal protein S18]-alanine N-acetyltransferase